MTMHNALAGDQLHDAFHYVSGSDPGAVGAGKYWLDTSGDPYALKRRNGADDGWIDVGAAGGSGDATWAIIQALSAVNELKNFPSLERADGAQPQWWDESANATLTEEDVAGESITESYERALKVVTTDDGEYAAQRWTYADEHRVKSGQKLSAVFAVWSVSAAPARVRIQSSVGSLAVSGDATAAGWTILRVENAALDGTWVEIRCEVDTGTAYFVPLGVNIGEKALMLRPRGLRRIQLTPPVSFLTDTTARNTAFQDEDVTAETSPLAVVIEVEVRQTRSTTGTSHTHIRTNWSSQAAGDTTRVGLYGTVPTNADVYGFYSIMLDDEQIFERSNEGGTVSETHVLHAYHEWE